VEDAVEVVHADSSLSVATADPQVWGYDGVECILGKVWEGDFLKMANFDLKPIQAVSSKESF
jgi:secreted protein with Ig-like and vWFA domain